MIKKMTSNDFNRIIEECTDKIETISTDIKNVKDEIVAKTDIIKYETDFINARLEAIENSSTDNDFIMMNNSIGGMYDRYGTVVHAKFKKNPLNIFNLKAVNSDYVFFRDEVTVSINGIKDDHYKNLLKDDRAIDKKIFFEEKRYNKDEDNSIVIDIEIDKSKSVGVIKYNMIEIDPYLLGSFDIEYIKIYEEDDATPTFTVDRINKCGKTRIILDKKCLFKKVSIKVIPSHVTELSGAPIIPFGLKHIFFLDGDFRTDSYCVIPYKSDRYIDYIDNEITLLTSFGKIETFANLEDIEVYLDYKNSVLENKHYISENIKRPIARNVNTVYFKIPLIKNGKFSKVSKVITAIKFNIKKR